MHCLGFDGYVQRTRELLEATRALRRGVEAIDGFRLLGHPSVPIVAFTSSRHDLHEVADHLAGRGWHVTRQQAPSSLGVVVTRQSQRAVADFLADLRDAARAAAREPVERFFSRTRDVVVGAATRLLPRRLVDRVATIAAERLGVPESELLTRSASVFGIAPVVPARGDPTAAALDVLEAAMTLDPGLARILEPRGGDAS
jgi:hypothetical protein